MIMPNLPAFVAWGLITALFIKTGWLPSGILGGFGNADLIGWQGAATQLAQAPDNTTFPQYVGLVGPMITYLLPLLIANAGGRIIYGERGGVIGCVATMGVIAGSNVPMFLGAMLVGPSAAWLMMKVDGIWEGKIKPGFEMLVNMFSAGILGAVLSVGAFFGIAPLVTQISAWLGDAVSWLATKHLLPLMSIIVEPAKVLFLNNAIGNGVLVPLGIQQTLASGKSLLFLVESNPGPGVGILLAYMLFGVGYAKASAWGATDHRALRRHPRGLLPVRAHEAAPHPRRHRRWYDGSRHQRGVWQWPARPGITRQHLRDPAADNARQLFRRDPLGGAFGRRIVPRRVAHAAGITQG